MAGGSAIEAGKAFVQYVLDDSKLDGQLAGIAKKLQGLADIGFVVSGAILGGLGASAVTFASVGNELELMSEKTGIGVEKLSEYKFAAQQTGVDLDLLTRAFKNLQKDGIDPAKFDQIAAQIRAIPDATARAQAAIEIFGSKTGQALLPMIEQLPELTGEAREFGLTMSSGAARDARELWQALELGKAQIVALASAIGGAIAGPLRDFLIWAEHMTAWTIEFIHNNPNLIRGIGLVAIAIAAAATAMTVFAIAAVIAEAALNPILAAAAVGTGIAAAGAIAYGASQANSAITSPAAAPTQSSAVPGHESASDVVNRLDTLINLARNSGTVAGVG